MASERIAAGCRGCAGWRHATTAIVVALVALTAGRAVGQFGSKGSDFFPPDRTALQRLSKAKTLLDEGVYADAVRLLVAVLESSEDFFLEPSAKRGGSRRSLKTEARQLLGELPDEGRQSYELQFGPEARTQLDAAARARNLEQLEAVARRFFHTRAGYEATELLGLAHMEEGRPLAAALCFKRLQETRVAAEFEPRLSLNLAICWWRAGMPVPAAEALLRLKSQRPNEVVAVAGRERRVADMGLSPAAALSWLQAAIGPQPAGAGTGAMQWTMSRGDPGRNAVSLGSSPLLDRRWAVPTANDPWIERSLERLQQELLDDETAVVPAASPLAVDQLVFMRTIAGLTAIDFRTGKRIWHGSIDEVARQRLDGQSPQNESAELDGWLDRRTWCDATFGAMSSDGKCLFCIEDAGDPINAEPRQHPRLVIGLNGRQFVQNAPSHRARLAAYEIATQGKLKWDLGVASDAASDLAGAIFLGPPLPLGDRLYTLVEVKGEIRLLAIEAENGRVEWSQQLAVLETNSMVDAVRRCEGLTPSFSDGVLVCPTGAGCIVAVDLGTRSLLWGYQYETHFEGLNQRIYMSQFGNRGQGSTQWIDNTLTIAAGCVLLTPAEDGHLRCLSLVDGKELWKMPREDGLYVACVHRGNVLVVGRKSYEGHQLDDGEAAWRDADKRRVRPFPEGAVLSGRGFYNGRHYFVPLGSGEVMAIDMETGLVTGRARSRSGRVPGNLVSHGGYVLSQSGSQLECFPELEELRRDVEAQLARSPNEPTVWKLHAELLLGEGKFDQAIDLLRKSLVALPDARTRRMLFEGLLERLKLDFVAHRGDLAELETLVDQPEQRLRLLRQAAQGLRQSGEIVSAFEKNLQVLTVPIEGDGLDRVEARRSLRIDCWAQAELTSLIGLASPADLKAISALLRRRLEAAEADADPRLLREFVDMFSDHELAEEAREKLAERIAGRSSTLEQEQLLRRLTTSADVVRARAAVVRLARLLVDAGRPNDAMALLAQLAGPLVDQPLVDGKTGAQWLETLAAAGAPRVSADAMTRDPWPAGRVHHEVLKGQTTMNQRFRVEMRGPRGPYFVGWNIEVEQGGFVVGRDPLGVERWRVPLVENQSAVVRQNQFGNGFQVGFPVFGGFCRADGHLLILAQGFQLLAIDTLGTPGRDKPRVLWRQMLVDSPAGNMMVGAFNNNRPVPLAWGAQPMIAVDAAGRPINFILAGGRVVFQRHKSIVCVDALSGQTLWIRHGLPPSCDLVGDDELLFATPPDSNDAIVLRTLDGREERQADGNVLARRVPGFERRLMTLGRRILSWNSIGRGEELVLTDVWTGNEVWRREFQRQSKPFPIDNEAVAVLERDGGFTILSAADGNVEIEADLTPEKDVSDIWVLRGPTRDVLVTNGQTSSQRGESEQANPIPANGHTDNRLINGFAHGFDRRTGKYLYRTAIDNRMLVMNQPEGLPMLILAAQVTGQRRQQQPPARPQQVALLCIEKRDGRVLFNESLGGQTQWIDAQGDLAAHAVLVKTSAGNVSFTLTADADATSPEKTAPAKSDKPAKPNPSKTEVEPMPSVPAPDQGRKE